MRLIVRSHLQMAPGLAGLLTKEPDNIILLWGVTCLILKIDDSHVLIT